NGLFYSIRDSSQAGRDFLLESAPDVVTTALGNISELLEAAADTRSITALSFDPTGDNLYAVVRDPITLVDRLVIIAHRPGLTAPVEGSGTTSLELVGLSSNGEGEFYSLLDNGILNNALLIDSDGDGAPDR